MKIVGEILSNQEMLSIKGGYYTCQCRHNIGVFTCNTMAKCIETGSWACESDGTPAADMSCQGIEQPPVD